MPQNNTIASLRRLAWRVVPAPLLNLAFRQKLSGLGELIEGVDIADADKCSVSGVSQPCVRLELRDGTSIVSTEPAPNNVKITQAARQRLGLGPEYSKALVDLILRYSFPHALVPVMQIPVADEKRGGFHLQHRNLPQESDDFNPEQRAFLRETFAPQPGWRVLDIGCYLGHGSTHLSQLVGDTGQIVSVEAIPENAAIAAFQLEANGITNGRVLHRAIWRSACESISINTTENQANAIATDVIDSTAKIEVSTTSIPKLTAMLNGPADLVSMTVNGAEVEAVEGLEALGPSSLPRRLVMPGWYPTDDGESRAEILASRLQRLGYQTLKTRHEFVIAWRFDS